MDSPVTLRNAHHYLILIQELEAALRPETSLVSIMMVNNEIGVRQPIEEIGEMCRARKVFVHTDAAQVCACMI